MGFFGVARHLCSARHKTDNRRSEADDCPNGRAAASLSGPITFSFIQPVLRDLQPPAHEAVQRHPRR